MKTPLLPSDLLFIGLVLLTGALAMGGSNWIFCYCGLVLNTVVMVPCIIRFSLFSVKDSESCSKYFMMQSASSSLFGLGMAIYFHWDLGSTWVLTSQEWGGVILCTSLFCKLGLFPFYAWVPGVLLGVSWACCWVLLTWQKYFTFVLVLQCLAGSGSEGLYFGAEIVASCSGLIGAWLGMGHTNLRALIGYSSLVHGCWSLLACILGLVSLSIYLTIYAISLGTSLYMMFLCGARVVQSPAWVGGGLAEPYYAGVFVVSVFSLAGVPPFLGFLGKWLVISQWADQGMSASALGCALFSSFLSLKYYLSMCWGMIFRAACSVSMDVRKHKKVPVGFYLGVHTVPTFLGMYLLDIL